MIRTITNIKEAREVMAAQNKDNPLAKPTTARHGFGTKEFDDLLKNLLKETPMNPAVQIKLFQKVTANRGYDFFSHESIADWQDKYGHITNDEIYRWAEGDKLLFMSGVIQPNDPDHNKNRLLFASQFGSDEAKVKEHFLALRNNEAGRSVMPLRNTSHEKRVLTFGQIGSKHAVYEFGVWRQLYEAKISSCGYIHDEAYKKKFLNDYAISLIP